MPLALFLTRVVTLAEAPEKVHFSFGRDECESRFEDQEHTAVAEKATSDQAQNNRNETDSRCSCRGGDSNVDSRQNEGADREVKAGQNPLQQTGSLGEKVKLVRNHQPLRSLLRGESAAGQRFKLVRQ